MDIKELIKNLQKRESIAKLGGGKARIDKEHRKGKLTARERLERLFDPDTFFEVGLFATHRCQDFGLADKVLPGDGVVTGYGLVNNREVFAFAQDATVMGGSLGGCAWRKNL